MFMFGLVFVMFVCLFVRLVLVFIALWIGMFMFGLVLVMFVCLFVRLVLVFRCILVVTAFVNWFTVWCFFPGSTGFCTYDKIVNIIIHFIEDSKTKKSNYKNL